MTRKSLEIRAGFRYLSHELEMLPVAVFQPDAETERVWSMLGYHWTS